VNKSERESNTESFNFWYAVTSIRNSK
jgi:hypothetical protein